MDFFSSPDDCSRRVNSRCSEGKRVDVLNVLKNWKLTNGKLKTVMHDNRKLFKSMIFRHLLAHNHIWNSRIPNLLHVTRENEARLK